MLIITTSKKQRKLKNEYYELGLNLGFTLRKKLKEADERSMGFIMPRFCRELEQILKDKGL